MDWRLGALALVVSSVVPTFGASTAEAQRVRQYELYVGVGPWASNEAALTNRIRRCIGNANREFRLEFRVSVDGGRARAVERTEARGRPRAIPCIQRAIRAHEFGRVSTDYSVTVWNHIVRPRSSCMRGGRPVE